MHLKKLESYDLSLISNAFLLFSDAGVLAATLTGHTDAIWGLSFHGPRQQLLSSSADGTVKLWSPVAKKMLQSYGPDLLLHGCPSSVDWVYDDPNHMAVAFISSAAGIYDVETGKQVIQFDTSSQVTLSSSIVLTFQPLFSSLLFFSIHEYI